MLETKGLARAGGNKMAPSPEGQRWPRAAQAGLRAWGWAGQGGLLGVTKRCFIEEKVAVALLLAELD